MAIKQLVIFKLDDEAFGVDILQVKEIRRLRLRGLLISEEKSMVYLILEKSCNFRKRI